MRKAMTTTHSIAKSAYSHHRPWSCRDNRAHYLNITTMTWEDGGYSIKTWPGALEGENLTIIP